MNNVKVLHGNQSTLMKHRKT